MTTKIERESADRLLDEDEVHYEAPDGSSYPASERQPRAARALGIHPVSADELLNVPPPRQFLLRDPDRDGAPGVLPRGIVGMLAAPGGTGKTWALVDLAVSLCCGVSWLGAWQPERGLTGRVALVLCEEDRNEALRRIHSVLALRFARGSAELVAAHKSLEQRLMLAAPATVKTAAVHAALHDGGKWDAVLMDPLARFGEDDTETDAMAATKTIQGLEALTRLQGSPLVLVAHHTRKGTTAASGVGQDAVRGQSALVDGARWVALMYAHRLGNTRWTTFGGAALAKLEVVKANHVPTLDPLRLALDPEHGGALRLAAPGELDEWAEAKAEADRKRPAPKKQSKARKVNRADYV